MYSPHDPGASHPLDSLTRWSRDGRPRWAQWPGAILASSLAVALIGGCLFLLVVPAFLGPHIAGVYPISDRHDPVIFSISMGSADEGWAVGTENRLRTQGMLAHYQHGK